MDRSSTPVAPVRAQSLQVAPLQARRKTGFTNSNMLARAPPGFHNRWSAVLTYWDNEKDLILVFVEMLNTVHEFRLKIQASWKRMK
ncbi:hypothetical protein VNO77_33869 [Canavalia gladiata]|uniref:Uncharacterized protein n=1 Tax=Canavalia gladiata TaxID=3824 RepID=A0AAN9KE59_CANGL